MSTIAEINNSMLKFLKDEPSHSLRADHALYDYQIEKLVKFSNEFDSTGELTLVYLAAVCLRQIKSTVAPIMAMLLNSHSLEPYWRCMQNINSEVVKECRRNIVNRLAAIISSVSEQGLIGDANAIDEALDDAVEAIFDSFAHLRFEVYLNSGLPVEDFDHFSSSVQVSGSLAEMLLRLEKAPDGIYVGYVSNPGLDGWFGFFCKSRGSMFSYNERIDEAYVGQHNNMRNGRYTDDKAYELFPYELVKFSEERDYKGYSKEMDIEDQRQLLDTNNFGMFIRTILSMALISRRHIGSPVNGDAVIVNSLIASNLAKLKDADVSSTAIVKWEASPLVKASAAFETPVFDEGKVIRGEYNAEFNHGNGKSWRVSGWFNGTNQDIVDAYAEGFHIEQERLLSSNSSRRLIGDKQTEQEFIGSPERMRLNAYYEVRRQLAHYISRRMQDDLDKFGGLEGLEKWFAERLKERVDKVLSYCRKTHERIGNAAHDRVDFGESETQPIDSGFRAVNHSVCVYFAKKPMYSRIWLSDMKDFDHICPITGAKANFFFKFEFSTYLQVQDFLGCELPKFCVGWRENKLYNGNPILDVTDPVGNIKSPLIGIYCRNPFSFSIGLSKSGLNKLAKAEGATK